MIEIAKSRRAAGVKPVVFMRLWLHCTGANGRSSFDPLNETSQPIELLLSVVRDGRRTLGAQIEEQLRQAIREGALRADTRLPSTRDLARQLGVSRRVVVDAYAQLASEGYLDLRQGARPRVSQAVAVAGAGDVGTRGQGTAPRPRFDFSPSVPDVSTFPRKAWLRSLREALATISDADLGYGDPCGVDSLRSALADYLGRVRGVVADPARIVVTCGYTQSLGLVCHALAAVGASRIALDAPSNPDERVIAARAGLEPVPIGVDDDGLRVDELARTAADAVIVTPAHQHPTGAVLSGERRAALLAWLRARDAIAIEDDYDAEYRYDRAAVGALQGLEPDRVVYAGSVSKTLAPALRLGWLVVPPSLIEAVTREKVLADRGTSRIEQHALAAFLARGELDRHLRRMRLSYRRRRTALVDALADALPEATVRGISAGLHATVELPAGDDVVAIQEEAGRRRIAFETTSDYGQASGAGPPTLFLGFGQLSEPAIRAGVRELAEAVRELRDRG
jgi:GntR family transcriptional regulator/MocR family aminotransferase